MPGYYTWNFVPIPLALLALTVAWSYWYSSRGPK